MYLERFRRTKVSNVLRSVEGRNLPAVHADGSLVQIKARITRADTGSGDTSSNMLFKGVIKRLDALNTSEDSRTGFNEKNVIRMSKEGIISYLDRSILTLLGYGNEKDPEEYIGQTIETLIPPVPNRPRQLKSFWIPQGLANQDLNFYILLVNKTYQLLPFTYCLSMETPDTILLRLRDLLSTDALITIDDLGLILSVNEDAFLLLGHEPDEIVGRNIKYILAEEIAVQHDGFLLRYKETRVARVVGIPRNIETIHRDQTSFPIEIQVTELQTAEGSTYIGRIRHIMIDYKVPRDLIEGLFVRLKSDEQEEDEEQQKVLLKSLQGSAILASRISVASEKAKTESIVGSQVKEAEKSGSSDSGSSSSSSSSDDEEDNETENTEIQVLKEGLDNKITKIRKSKEPIPSQKRLAFTLNLGLASLVLISVVALIASNVLATPVAYFKFGDELNIESNVLNNVINLARMMYLQEHADDILESKNTISTYWPCTWGEPTKAPLPVLKKCEFSGALHPKEDLQAYAEHLSEAQHWFAENYPKIRQAGDTLDKVYNTPFDYNEYSGAQTDPANLTTIPTWTDFIGSKLLDALEQLAEDPNIVPGQPGRYDWQFIIANRDIMANQIKAIQDATYKRAEEVLVTEATMHLALTIITIVIAATIFWGFLLQRIKEIQTDRLVILKLLLLIPRAMVWNFVSQVYRDQDDDDDDDDDATTTDNNAKSQTTMGASKSIHKLKSDETIEVLQDDVYKLYLFFGLLIFSITIPPIVHVAWRYSFNADWGLSLDHYVDVVTFYTTINSLLWRATGLWALKDFVPTNDKPFWLDLETAKSRLKTTKDTVCYFLTH